MLDGSEIATVTSTVSPALANAVPSFPIFIHFTTPISLGGIMDIFVPTYMAPWCIFPLMTAFFAPFTVDSEVDMRSGAFTTLGIGWKVSIVSITVKPVNQDNLGSDGGLTKFSPV